MTSPTLIRPGVWQSTLDANRITIGDLTPLSYRLIDMDVVVEAVHGQDDTGQLTMKAKITGPRDAVVAAVARIEGTA